MKLKGIPMESSVVAPKASITSILYFCSIINSFFILLYSLISSGDASSGSGGCGGGLGRDKSNF